MLTLDGDMPLKDCLHCEAQIDDFTTLGEPVGVGIGEPLDPQLQIWSSRLSQREVGPYEALVRQACMRLRGPAQT